MKSKVAIKTVEDIHATPEVQSAVKALANLGKPTYELRKYLERVGNLHTKTLDDLEKYMAVYIAWQNYLGEQTIIADAIRTVAESQVSNVYSMAVNGSEGTINSRKESARSDTVYQKALAIKQEADAYYNAIVVSFENCERAYMLVSRILTKRLNIRENI